MNLIHLNGAAIAVSRDHKPDQTDERQRIEDAGGFVMWAGMYRCLHPPKLLVNGVLNLQFITIPL